MFTVIQNVEPETAHKMLVVFRFLPDGREHVEQPSGDA